MLLEHIAAEEGKRLFADDKEQAAHLVTLRAAADQASSLTVDPGPVDSLPYSSSVSTIFRTYDQLDRNGLLRESSDSIEQDFYQYEGHRGEKGDRGERGERGERGDKSSGKRYRDVSEKGVRESSSSSSSSSSAAINAKKKKNIGPSGGSSGTVKAVRSMDVKVKVGLTHSSSASVLTDNRDGRDARDGMNGRDGRDGRDGRGTSAYDFMSQTQTYHTLLNDMGGGGADAGGGSNVWRNDYLNGNGSSSCSLNPLNPSYPMNQPTSHGLTSLNSQNNLSQNNLNGQNNVNILNSVSSSSNLQNQNRNQHGQQGTPGSMSFGYAPRTLYEQQMMTLSGSHSNMTPMVPGTSHLWSPDAGESAIPGLLNSSGFTGLNSGWGGSVYENKNNDFISNINIGNEGGSGRGNGLSNGNGMLRSDSHNSISGMQGVDQQQHWQQQQQQQWLQQQRFLFQQHQHQHR